MIEMNKQDLEELHQLLVLYGRTYRDSSLASGLLEEVARRYSRNYGEDIWEKRNPRNAGEKTVYGKRQGQDPRATGKGQEHQGNVKRNRMFYRICAGCIKRLVFIN